MVGGVQAALRWSPRRAFQAYQLCALNCLDSYFLTHFGLEVLQLDLIADDCVGLSHILGVYFVVGMLAVDDLAVGCEEVLVDVLV